MKTISKPAALRLNHQNTAHGAGFFYSRHFAQQQSLVAAPSADLLTLVIAEAIKRKAQAEIQRDVLREAIYEIPVLPERDHDRGAAIYPADPDDYV
ncbi:hypothetical protein PQR68_12080 [Paraburkholderia agricolaris]|uniref:Uncharacterized protein n=1 Tax=Paraburkholderia agricolaris TaxID=2152888 RepID=A0ABW8ZI11_9BURK